MTQFFSTLRISSVCIEGIVLANCTGNYDKPLIIRIPIS